MKVEILAWTPYKNGSSHATTIGRGEVPGDTDRIEIIVKGVSIDVCPYCGKPKD